MSELKKTRDASTYQKLPPPKSLLGEEDAEVTWEIILKRYPNAAPLLCEMENVIERAEGLLNQLRSPYTQALDDNCRRPVCTERSSSFQIADSQDDLTAECDVEKSTEVSILSEQCYYSDSAAAEDSAIPEIMSEAQAGDSISHQGLENCAQTEEEQPSIPGASSSYIYESNSMNPDPDWEPKISLKSFISSGASFTRSQKSRQGIPESVSHQAIPVSSKVPRVDRSLNGSAAEVEKTSSLEAWGKVVGETTTIKIMGKSSGPSGFKECSPPVVSAANAKG
nr:uncharacterized protein LOC124217228 [Neodiprion pinetum]